MSLHAKSTIPALLRGMRMHQWAKNLLVFVPIVSSQHYGIDALGAGTAAFFAFSLAASAGYVFNDIVDRDADRKHPAKRDRPFARGDILISAGIAAIPLLLAGAFALAWAVSLQLAGILAVYLAGTVFYSLVLKRILLIDVITLAAFYTLRVFGGAVAISVPVSEWLMIFCLFIFCALAIIKRYCEIAIWLETGTRQLVGRDYSDADLPALLALASATSIGAVIVLALYARSDAVRNVYAKSDLLLLICPILFFWLSRLIMLAHRRVLTHDPILFAIGDWISWLAVAAAAAVILAAL